MKKSMKSQQKMRLTVSTQPKIFIKSPLSSTIDHPSYSQLKIILQSVKKIKEHAQQQISQLKNQNKALKEQCISLKQIIHNQNLKDHQLISTKNYSRERDQQQIQQLKQQIHDLNQINIKLEIQKQKYIFIQNTLKQEIENMHKQIRAKDKQYLPILKQMKAIGLVNNENIYQYQLIKLIKIQFQNIPQLISLYKQKIDQINSKKSDISIIQEKIYQETQKLKFNQQVIQKYKIQIQNLKNQLEKTLQSFQVKQFENNNQIKKLNQQIQKYKNINIDLQKQIVKLQKQYGSQQHINHNEIQNLRKKINQLQKQIKNMNDIQNQKKKKVYYQQLVNKVCQKTIESDNERILKHIEYLEKYRSQYYYNIQKIQYLCRLLDS